MHVQQIRIVPSHVAQVMPFGTGQTQSDVSDRDVIHACREQR